jgi:hypothetical protein
MVRVVETVKVKSNLIITMRDRGKIVARRKGHNIWLDLGRGYLASLIGYTSFSPLTTERDDRVRYIALGVGGDRQIAPSVSGNPPISTSYPGGNDQTDTDPTIQGLQRPVRLSGDTADYVHTPTGIWMGQVQPVSHPTASQSQFVCLFTLLQISYAPFLTVPLSEAGLFTNRANPAVAPKASQPSYDATSFVAYDTFDTISKTAAFELEVNWTVRF